MLGWDQLSLGGIVAIFVMMIGVGWLVPRWVLTRWTRNLEDQIAYHKSMVDKRDEQFDRLVDQTELIVRLLEDLKTVSKMRAELPP